MSKRCRTFCSETRERCVEEVDGHPMPCVFSEEDRRLRDSVYSLYIAQRENILFYRQEECDTR